jgi:hypothetical protein
MTPLSIGRTLGRHDPSISIRAARSKFRQHRHLQELGGEVGCRLS